jgi:hypothetical protein
MAAYRLRYVCETSLLFGEDVSLTVRGKNIHFLFSQKQPTENSVCILVDAEAEHYQQADLKAQSILQPALDALSFSTGSPLLLEQWDFIIKEETGSKARRAIWCKKRREPAPLRLIPRAVDEAQKMLAEGGESGLELCWHRYAVQRGLILDRFVFQWLAFEGLAGTSQIPTTCPQCGSEVTHCEKPISHEGSNGDQAYQLFSRIEAAGCAREFRRDIWGKTRNSVFHGSKYPSPEFLSRLHSLTPKLRQACDVELGKRYKLDEQPRPVRDPEFHIYRYNMFEWETATPENAFAEDFPWEAVNKEFGNMAPEEVRAGFPDTWPFKLLDFARESAGW